MSEESYENALLLACSEKRKIARFEAVLSDLRVDTGAKINLSEHSELLAVLAAVVDKRKLLHARTEAENARVAASQLEHFVGAAVWADPASNFAQAFSSLYLLERRLDPDPTLGLWPRDRLALHVRCVPGGLTFATRCADVTATFHLTETTRGVEVTCSLPLSLDPADVMLSQLATQPEEYLRQRVWPQLARRAGS
eukprot:m.244833 g.244833  ORF g.244833 m.244833 type:complete len:196 (+) comp33409_c0_seq1:12-599(+)